MKIDKKMMLKKHDEATKAIKEFLRQLYNRGITEETINELNDDETRAIFFDLQNEASKVNDKLKIDVIITELMNSENIENILWYTK